jgi:hypothetical protein
MFIRLATIFFYGIKEIIGNSKKGQILIKREIEDGIHCTTVILRDVKILLAAIGDLQHGAL